jgi:hypothetical protein
MSKILFSGVTQYLYSLDLIVSLNISKLFGYDQETGTLEKIRAIFERQFEG